MSASEPPGSTEQPSASSPKPPSNGVGIDRDKTSWASWKNWINAVTGRFDENTLLDYLDIFDDENEKGDIARCIENRDYILKWSPTVNFLQKKIRMLGGDLNKNNMRCMKCRALKGSGFDPDYGIQLCANRTKRRNMLEDCMAHGMSTRTCHIIH